MTVMTDFANLDLREKCVRCGHAWSFHSKSTTSPCKAMGCRAGDEGQRCGGFLMKAEPRALLSSRMRRCDAASSSVALDPAPCP